MAKKKSEKQTIKPNCEYCKHGTDMGNHMSGCHFHLYPRSNGIRGIVQCDKGRFELSDKKYNMFNLKNKSPT